MAKDTEKKTPERHDKALKSFSETYGATDFYVDLEKRNFRDLLDKTYVLEDARILKNFKGEFAPHDAALMMFSELENPDNRFTTINSGVVIIDRINQWIVDGKNPILATPVSIEPENGNPYYNLK